MATLYTPETPFRIPNPIFNKMKIESTYIYIYIYTPETPFRIRRWALDYFLYCAGDLLPHTQQENNTQGSLKESSRKPKESSRILNGSLRILWESRDDLRIPSAYPFGGRSRPREGIYPKSPSAYLLRIPSFLWILYYRICFRSDSLLQSLLS